MGAAQSYITPETALTTGVIIAGAVAFTVSNKQQPVSATGEKEGQRPSPSSAKRKGKRKKAEFATNSQTLPSKPSPVVVDFPAAIPGDFEAEPLASSTNEARIKKTKKRKKKANTDADEADADEDGEAEASADGRESMKQSHANSSTIAASVASAGAKTRSASALESSMTSNASVSSLLKHSTASIDTDSSWTRVVPTASSSKRSRTQAKQKGQQQQHVPGDQTPTTDAGISTTSVTGDSSPVVSRTEDEYSPSGDDSNSVQRRTFAEKMLPKARKTGVEDMLQTPDVPSLSRVMKVVPQPDQKPVSGFSWGDYEDVALAGGGDNTTGNEDADGEDDDGWGIVKSRGRSHPSVIGGTAASSSSFSQTPTSSPQTMTKRQRQNANKKEAVKQAKVDAEKQRLAQLARHKRELEQARIMEQYSSGKSKGAAQTSGGMSASVDEKGRLVWD